MKTTNKKISDLLKEIADLLEVKGVNYKPAAYRKASLSLESLEDDISEVYEKKGVKGVTDIPKIGKSIAEKIEEYLKKGKIKQLEELRKETAIRQIVTHYFETKGISLKQLKENAKKRTIIYSRYTKPAKELLCLAGSVKNAKKAIDVISEWAQSRKLDYTIETAIKRWPEIKKLKPKEKKKKPYFRNDPMVWSKTKEKWFVINKTGDWLEFAGKEEEMEWREEE
jgi:5S rRNA maturation endonuclease (ribonuclease M5)